MCERPVRSNSELLEIRWHRIIIVCFACLASAPSPIVLADAPPSALPARTLSSIVLADALSPAIPTPVPYPIMLCNLEWFIIQVRERLQDGDSSGGSSADVARIL